MVVLGIMAGVLTAGVVVGIVVATKIQYLDWCVESVGGVLGSALWGFGATVLLGVFFSGLVGAAGLGVWVAGL